MQCKYIKKDGEQCNKSAKKGYDFCSAHIALRKRHASKTLSHGRQASPDTLGIPPNMQKEYDEFYNSSDITNLRRELALSRTLHAYISATLRLTDSNFIPELENDIRNDLIEYFNNKIHSTEKALQVADDIFESIMPIILKAIPPIQLDHKTIRQLMDALDLISKIAERMKKIQEGIKIHVTYDGKILMDFLQATVFAFVKDSRTLDQIASAARGYVKRTFGNQRILDAPIDDKYLAQPSIDEITIEGEVL